MSSGDDEGRGQMTTPSLNQKKKNNYGEGIVSPVFDGTLDEGLSSNSNFARDDVLQASSNSDKIDALPPSSDFTKEDATPSNSNSLKGIITPSKMKMPVNTNSTVPQDNPLARNTSEISDTVSEDLKQISKKSESTTALVELKKELGLWNGVGIIVGIMIGSGIFVSPSTVIKYSGSIGMSLIVWVLTGLMSMVGALCFAELGTMIPKSGAVYTYVLEAFGPIPAFLILWINITIQRPSSRAINAITFATYLLQPIFPNCVAPPYYAVRILGSAMLCLITYINCSGVRFGTRVQDSFTLLKVLATIVIIVAGGIHIIQGNVENFRNPMEGTIQSTTSIATAFYSTLFAYSGWNSLNSLTEELKDPYRNLPRAIAISIITVIVIYTLTNIAYFAVLTPAEILSSSAVAVTFGSRTLGVLAWIISLFVACSTFGNTNGNIITQSRLMFVAAKEGQLPHFLKLIHVNKLTPVTSIISVAVLPMFMLLVPDIGSLLAYTSFTRNLGNLFCVLALLWLRYRDPDRHRPIKIWLGFPILYLCLTTFIAVFPVVQRPLEIGVAVAIFLSGFVVYYITIYLKIKILSDAMDKVTYVCQLVFQCVEEEKMD